MAKKTKANKIEFDDDFDGEDIPDDYKPKARQSERQRFIREQIEFRMMAKALGISDEDYPGIFNDRQR